MAFPNSPDIPEKILDTLDLSFRTKEKVLSSFRGLLEMPDVLQKVKEKISTMDNGISKQLLEATLRRVMNITLGTEQIHKSTQEKLSRLLARVESNQGQSA